MASHAQRDDGTVVVWCHDDGRFMPKALHPARISRVPSRKQRRGHLAPPPSHQAGHDLCEPGLVKSPDGKHGPY